MVIPTKFLLSHFLIYILLPIVEEIQCFMGFQQSVSWDSNTVLHEGVTQCFMKG